MPRGAPDYSNVRAYGPLHRLDDQAELAARLGSPVLYSRSGSVVWMTDFERGLQGSTFGTDGAPSAGSLSTARANLGAFSIMLDPQGVADSYVEYGRVVHFVPVGKLSLEASVSTDSDPYGLRLKMFYFTGTTQYYGGLHYDPATGDWKVRNAANAWPVVLEDFKIQQGAGAWTPIKLVVDVENEVYVRAEIAKHFVDLSSHSMYQEASTNNGQLDIRVIAYGSVASHAAVWADGIIVSQNEPDNP